MPALTTIDYKIILLYYGISSDGLDINELRQEADFLLSNNLCRRIIKTDIPCIKNTVDAYNPPKYYYV